MRQWNIYGEHTCPSQTNGVDCGVFPCHFAENVSRKGAFQMSGLTQDMQRVRQAARKKRKRSAMKVLIPPGTNKFQRVNIRKFGLTPDPDRN